VAFGQAIGGWTPAELRRFVVNTLQDPGAQPESIAKLPKNPTDGDVPVWNAAQKKWQTSSDIITPLYLQTALANPVLRFQTSNTSLGGQAAGSYLMINGNPKTPATLANLIVPQWRYEPSLDDPPLGYKTQWQLVVAWETNATLPGGTHIHAPWAFTSAGGAAGGYVQTMSGSFTTVQANVSVFTGGMGQAISGWIDHGETNAIQSNTTYMMGVNYSAALAANSAIQEHAQLFRRFVPA